MQYLGIPSYAQMFEWILNEFLYHTNDETDVRETKFSHLLKNILEKSFHIWSVLLGHPNLNRDVRW